MKIPSDQKNNSTEPQELFKSVERINHAYLEAFQSRIADTLKQIQTMPEELLDNTILSQWSQMVGQAVQTLTKYARLELPRITMKAISRSWEDIKKAFNSYNVFAAVDSTLASVSKQISQQMNCGLDFVRAHQDWEKAAEKYALIMIEAEWPPVLDIPSQAVHEIIEAYNEMPIDQFKTEICEAMLDFYDERELRSKFEKWRSTDLLSRRISILTDVIEGHLEGRYNLTIPTVLTQIEGFIGDISEHRGRMRGKDIERYLTDLFDNRLASSPFDRVKSLIIDRIFQHFEWGDRIANSISRHAILHGAMTDYGTKGGSLKCILLFDYIVRYYGKKSEEVKRN